MNIWQESIALTERLKQLNLDKTVIDYEKHKLYSIVTNSTQLEGCALTRIDTELLLDKGITAKGLSLDHHLMVKDNYNAIRFAIQKADENILLSPEFLKELNSVNMANTGQVVNNIKGTVDGRTGAFRLVNAFSEAFGYYLDPDKIPYAVDQFCQQFNGAMSKYKNNNDILKFSFDAHINLVLIHPWQDGNKRTSRLVMNFIQRRAGIPLTMVEKSNEKDYITAIKAVKEDNNLDKFRDFMINQHVSNLKSELEKYDQHQQHKGGFHLIL